MGRSKLNHRRKKKIERHRARKRAWQEKFVEEDAIWYYDDGGLLSVNWDRYDVEYWRERDWSAVGQNALEWQRFFSTLPPPEHYALSRQRRLMTAHESVEAEVIHK